MPLNPEHGEALCVPQATGLAMGAAEDAEPPMGPPHAAGGEEVRWGSCFGNILAAFTKGKHTFHLRTQLHRCISNRKSCPHGRTSTNVPSSISRRCPGWRESPYPSAGEPAQKTWPVPRMDYYSAIKKEASPGHAAVRGEPQNPPSEPKQPGAQAT